MIAVVVRQDDQVYRWQVCDLTCRFDLAPGPDAMTEIDVPTFVEEGRISENCQSTVVDQSGGVTDEVDFALNEIGCLIAD